MKIRILKESKLLQEKIEVTTDMVQNNKDGLKVYFTVDTGEVKVKQLLTIRGKETGTAFVVFDEQLPKVQKCFPKPPEITTRGETLDPIHQIQIDYGYVIQEPQYTLNSMGQETYSHDNNLWILGDPTYYGPTMWDIDFHVVEIDNKGEMAPGQQFNTNPFNSLRASMVFFRKLTQLIGEYVAKYPYRFYYFFGVTEQGESSSTPSKRTQLYTTMLKRMYKELGGNWVQFEETYKKESIPNSVFFFKCPNGSVSESRKRKHYLTEEDKTIIHEAYLEEIKRKKRKKRRKKRKPRAAYWWGYGLHDSDFGDAGDGGGGDGKRDDELSEDQIDEKKKKKKKKRKVKKKKKKAGSESSKETSLHHWFKRKGAKGKKKGWVDCNAPDGSGGYKSCGRSDGEKRKKYPACRPTPGACKERGRGKSWGKKGSKRKNK